MSFLLDTNVVSELVKRRKDPGVLDWFAATRGVDHYVSVLTIGEIRRGIQRLRRRGDDDQAGRLDLFLDGVRAEYEERIVPVSLAAADAWAAQPASRPMTIVDALIAATAQAHGWTLVTRNAKDFEPTGVRVLNPFST